MGEWTVNANTLALYHCNDGSGTTVTDAVGTYDGTLTDASAWSGTAKFGSHSIDADEQYYFTNGTLLDTMPADGTIELWFSPNATIDTSHGWYHIIGKFNDFSNNEYIALYVPENDNKLLYLHVAGGAAKLLYSTTTTWTGGTWYHVRMTWGSSGMELWIDGSKEDTDASTDRMNDGTHDEFFAGAQDDSPARRHFPGKIDEIRVSDTQYSDGGTEEEGTNTEINIGDAWKTVSGIKINIADAWKDVSMVQVNIGDSWKTVFGS